MENRFGTLGREVIVGPGRERHALRLRASISRRFEVGLHLQTVCRWILPIWTGNVTRMETVLWQTLAGTRGGPNRARVVRALADQPRNANQLADDLDLAYNTVRYHLDVLEDNGVITSSDADYGVIYLPSERARNHWDTIERILTQVDD